MGFKQLQDRYLKSLKLHTDMPNVSDEIYGP